jgi:hypothetical protein
MDKKLMAIGWMGFGGSLAAHALHWLMRPAQHPRAHAVDFAAMSLLAAMGIGMFVYGLRSRQAADREDREPTD